MFNDKGVAYAPWMVDSFDPENLAKQKAAREAREERLKQEPPKVVGDLARDPQAMELSGVGLRTKVRGGEVELEWRTSDEAGNLGFIISRRAGKTDDFIQVADYKSWPTLCSKGETGGTYTWSDPDSEEGAWVYRVTDVNKSGAKNDLCQALVEVQSAGEALQVKIAVAAFVLIGAGSIFLANNLDPLK